MTLPVPPSVKYICVKCEFEGVHSWPSAPAAVSFLRYEHRHLFKVEVYLSVDKSDREIEFIELKRWLENNPIKACQETMFVGRTGAFTKSCEDIAEDIGHQIREKYGPRELHVAVYEDGENGGVAVWSK